METNKIQYRKIPGKNWVAFITGITHELQIELINRIESYHSSSDEAIKALSDRASPIVTDRWISDGEDATLTVQFRSIHEHHQDYLNYWLADTPLADKLAA